MLGQQCDVIHVLSFSPKICGLNLKFGRRRLMSAIFSGTKYEKIRKGAKRRWEVVYCQRCSETKAGGVLLELNASKFLNRLSDQGVHRYYFASISDKQQFSGLDEIIQGFDWGFHPSGAWCWPQQKFKMRCFVSGSAESRIRRRRAVEIDCDNFWTKSGWKNKFDKSSDFVQEKLMVSDNDHNLR